MAGAATGALVITYYGDGEIEAEAAEGMATGLLTQGLIINDGEIGATGAQARGVHSEGGYAHIFNNGEIRASATDGPSVGVFFDLGHTAVLRNTGLIEADHAVEARHSLSYLDFTREELVVNTGEIRGKIILGVGKDAVHNRGVIVGDIELGLDDDRFDGRGGETRGVVYGEKGQDILLGGRGGDWLDGGQGNDILSGGEGADTLTGGWGQDVFRYEVGSGADVVTDFNRTDDRIHVSGYTAYQSVTQQGADALVRFSAGDTLLLLGVQASAIQVSHFVFSVPALTQAGPIGPGFSRPDVQDPDVFNTAGAIQLGDEDDDTASGDERMDTFMGAGGADRFTAGGGDDQAWGEEGEDELAGEGGVDRLDGGAGDDDLSGGDGDDFLLGQDGGDRIRGGAGDDLIIGGAGGDILVFRPGDGTDIFQDFDPSVDRIVLEGVSSYLTLPGAPFDYVDAILVPGGGVIKFSGHFDPQVVRAAVSFAPASIPTAEPGTAPAEPEPPLAAEGIVVEGTAGPDRLNGGSRDDVVWGRAGDDVLDGRGGNDVVDGGEGADILTGGLGNDQVRGWTGSDLFIYRLGDGEDYLPDFKPGEGDVLWLSGVSEGDVRLREYAGDLYIDMPDGGEVRLGTTSLLTVLSAPGSIRFGTPPAGWGQGMLIAPLAASPDGPPSEARYGSSGANILVGTESYDWLDALGGADIVRGLGGDDVLHGGNGADRLEGGDGDDELWGGAGNDTLTGGAGEDVLKGGDGDDLLRPGSGEALVDGGAGDDTVTFSEFEQGLTIRLGPIGGIGPEQGLWPQTGIGRMMIHAENVIGTAFDDEIIGYRHGAVGVDLGTYQGGLGSDIIRGGAGDNTLVGGSLDPSVIDTSANFLFGGAGGYDVLIGAAGDDVLIGAEGTSVLDDRSSYAVMTGGAGVDTFIYAHRVTDFDPEAEHIVLPSYQLIVSFDQEGDTLIVNYLSGGESISRLRLDGLTADDVNSSHFSDQYILRRSEVSGTAGADVIAGTEDVANRILGGDGNDRLTGGGFSDVLRGGLGDDILDGGSDTNRLNIADYSDAGGSVAVDLRLEGPQDTGAGGQDTLINIGGVSGSAFNDRLTGFGVLSGNAGDDILTGADLDGPFGLYGGELLGGTGDDLLIAAAQGSRLSGGSGADELRGGDGNDTLYGDDLFLEGVHGDDVAHGGGGRDSIYGEGGNDELWGGADSDIIGAGAGNDFVNGEAGDDYLAGFAGNDRLFGGDDQSRDDFIGGEGNDYIDIGNGGGSVDGEQGDDFIIAGDGQDWIDGDAWEAGLPYDHGYDTVSYERSTGGITANLITEQASGGWAAGDVLRNVEALIGSAFNDVMIGSTAANRFVGGAGVDDLRGGSGDDTLDGGAGDDRLDGASGIDRASYASATAGVTVSLSLTAAQDTVGAGRDTLIGIEELEGSAHHDTLTGATGNDLLVGGAGDDLLVGGLGADRLVGDAGSDTVAYGQSGAGVTVTLGASPGLGGEAEGDILTDIENVTGSMFVDNLAGDAASNQLIGLAGDDTLNGLAGDDVLVGGLGADALNGGDGSDTASYAGAAGRVIIRLFAGTAAGGEAVGDVLTSIENLVGTGFNDQLSGDGGDNTLEGGAGADILGGREGHDTVSYASSSAAVVINLANMTASGGDAAGDTFGSAFEGVIGSAFNDLLNGGNGDQTIEGGLGNDRLNGGAGFDTLSFRGAGTGITVNLATTTAQATGVGNDTISGFERVIGSAFADAITGDALDNVLVGGLGADTLAGAGGFDTADYSGSAAAVTVNLTTGTGLGGDAAGDTLSGIEALIGSGLNDSLTGDGSDNLLTGGAGADTLDGMGGTDTASYAGSDAAVQVNLGASTATGGHAQGDALTSIENLLGSAHDDVLIGDLNANLLEGGAGADVLDGEGGIDTVSYAGSVSRVTVNLTTGTGVGGHAQGDVISDVENVTGSAFGDTVYGSAGANRLEGSLGSDALYGRNGDDVLIGGLGNDALYGGAGADTFVFLGAGLGNDRVQDFSTTSGDIIELDASVFTDFADAMSATTDVGGSAVISRGGTTITITGVLKAQLSAGDFQFSSPAPALPEAKDGALVLPPVFDDLDPLILPAGLESKQAPDDLPVICPPGDEALPASRPDWDLAEMGLSTFDGRDPHRILLEPRGLDWIV